MQVGSNFVELIMYNIRVQTELKTDILFKSYSNLNDLSCKKSNNASCSRSWQGCGHVGYPRLLRRERPYLIYVSLLRMETGGIGVSRLLARWIGGVARSPRAP
jgi:hypothetical protein